MTILDRLDRDVQVSVSILPRAPNSQGHFQAPHT
jgi:hypothetical protein